MRYTVDVHFRYSQREQIDGVKGLCVDYGGNVLHTIGGKGSKSFRTVVFQFESSNAAGSFIEEVLDQSLDVHAYAEG